jgi:hypothetical protein
LIDYQTSARCILLAGEAEIRLVIITNKLIHIETLILFSELYQLTKLTTLTSLMLSSAFDYWDSRDLQVIPHFATSLPNLTTLNLSRTSISPGWIPVFKQLKELTALYLQVGKRKYIYNILFIYLHRCHIPQKHLISPISQSCASYQLPLYCHGNTLYSLPR